VTRRRSILKWKDIGGGIQVPIKMVLTQFDTSLRFGTLGEVYAEVETTVNFAKSSWNIDIPDATFQIPIPAGTKVADYLRDVQYITGKPDPGKNLEDLAATARHVSPLGAQQPATKPRWNLWSVASISLIIVVAIVALLAYRRKLRKGTHP
jgi:hypothetical protein